MGDASEVSTIEVVPPVPSVLHDPVAAPPWIDVVPDRKLLVVDATDRGILFVSCLTDGGLRVSIEVSGGYKNAERLASALGRGDAGVCAALIRGHRTSLVRIGREMYEGLPPKRPRAAAEEPKAEGTSPAAQAQ